MPLYDYHAFDSSGRKQKGVVEANAESEAKEKIRELGLMVSTLKLHGGSSKGSLKGDNLVAFTLQLAQLVNAGIPLFESMVAIEEQSKGESYHHILLSLCEQVRSGVKLSDAMRTFPASFDKLYCAMVASGEAVGSLDTVLNKLGTFLSKQNKLKKEISTALIYPCILGGFSCLVIAMLLGFVVPSIEGIFADRKLNGFTQFILSLSHFARDYFWIYMPFAIGLSVFGIMKLKSVQGKLWLQRTLLKTPLVKRLVVQAALARFSRTMGTLQEGGLNMIDSLRIATGVINNVVLEEEMKAAELKIIEGSSLSKELQKSKNIPSMVSRMLAIGEDAGSAAVMMNKIGEMYEEEVEKTITRLMALAQPVILIVMGGIIGLVMVAILLPLTDVASFTAG